MEAEKAPALSKVESSFSFEVLKREELKTLVSAETQCDDEVLRIDGREVKSFVFDRLDERKCLRCGLNDKTASDGCKFHPAMPKHAGGAGNLIYSEQWHKCRENC